MNTIFIILDFIARAEEFVDKLNFGSLLYLEKNITNISLDAMNHSKNMIVIANTMNYNSTAVLAFTKDFSVMFFKDDCTKIIHVFIDNNQWNFAGLCWIEMCVVM